VILTELGGLENLFILNYWVYRAFLMDVALAPLGVGNEQWI